MLQCSFLSNGPLLLAFSALLIQSLHDTFHSCHAAQQTERGAILQDLIGTIEPAVGLLR